MLRNCIKGGNSAYLAAATLGQVCRMADPTTLIRRQWMTATIVREESFDPAVSSLLTTMSQS
jgi:hypothetical protein